MGARTGGGGSLSQGGLRGCRAARYTRGMPHQKDAWEWLQQQLGEPELEGFAERFRTAPPPPASADLVTAAQCKDVFGREVTPAQLADLNACLKRFEIDTPARIAHFMAQIAHESGGLQWMEEIADGSAYEGRFDLGNTLWERSLALCGGLQSKISDCQ